MIKNELISDFADIKNIEKESGKPNVGRRPLCEEIYENLRKYFNLCVIFLANESVGRGHEGVRERNREGGQERVKARSNARKIFFLERRAHSA